MKKETSLFGKNFKYVLVMTALAWMTYTLPSVRAAFESASAFDASSAVAISASLQSAAAALSVIPPQPTDCPAGYTCIPSSQIGSWCPPNYQCTLQKPSVTSLSVNPQPVQAGKKATMTWTSSNTDYCSGAGNDRLNPSGSIVVGPFTATTTLTVTCFNGSASASTLQYDQKSVTVGVIKAITAVVSINGTVIDAATHRPITNAFIKVTVSGPGNPGVNMTGPSTFSVYSMAAGSYVITANALGHIGTYNLTITDQDEQYPHTLSVQVPVVTANISGPGLITATLDPATPQPGSVQISRTQQTDDIALMTFDLKSQNKSGTLRSVKLYVNTTATTSHILTNVKLKSGAQTYAPIAISQAGGYYAVTFTNLSIPLPQDVKVPLAFSTGILADTTGSLNNTVVTAALVADMGSVYVEDQSPSEIPVSSTTLTGNPITLSTNGGVSITGIFATKGNIVTGPSGVWSAAYPSIGFTINNAGNNPIYVSKSAVVAIGTTTWSGPVGSTTVSSVTVSGSSAGDTAAAYIVNGSRNFTYNFAVDNTNGSTGSKKIAISQIYYGMSGSSDTVDNTKTIDYGISNAYVQVP